MSPNPALIELARQIAIKNGLNDALVCAVVEQESGWNPDATRYEPMFYDRYIQKLILPLSLTQDEAKQRATSWGLMQLMGQVARELGFSEPIPSLCDAATGLDWGCRFLAKKLLRASGDQHLALLSWNGGGNALYPGQVIDRLPKYLNMASLDAGDL